MTDKQDPITHAARLLREAAEELRQAHAYNNSEGWENETDAKAAYDEHLAAAQALEDWEAAVGAGGVSGPLMGQPQAMPDLTALTEREALRTIGEEQAFEAWFKMDCPVEGANAKIAATAAWKARASRGQATSVEREQERIAFKDAHRHLELYEVSDAWGRPMFKHSHVEASWLGWIARASHWQAPAAPKRDIYE